MLTINISDIFLGLPHFHKWAWAAALTYLLMTCYFTINWLIFSARHPSSIPEEKFLSMVMFAITSILWPLGIIASCVEIIKTKQIKVSMAIACLVTLLMFSISLYLVEISKLS
jgi:hypothetical protein